MTLNKLLLSLQTHCSIVFLNYRESVERTAHFLSTQGFSVSAYHGGLDQRQREEALYQFANHSTNILVCTDLGSQGWIFQMLKTSSTITFPKRRMLTSIVLDVPHVGTSKARSSFSSTAKSSCLPISAKPTTIPSMQLHAHPCNLS